LNTRSLFCFTVAVSLLFSTRVANAACHFSRMRPTATLPTMVHGQQFSFVATDDCPLQLRFEVQGTNFAKIPVRSADLPSGDRTYTVDITESEWNTLMRNHFSLMFQWKIKEKGSIGKPSEVVTTNELDADRDGWTRSEGDFRSCDLTDERNPGLEEICDGIDQDCDNVVDEGVAWFRDTDRDGYGDDTDTRCTRARGYVAVGGDCDDSDGGLWCAMVDLSLADAKFVGEEDGDSAGFRVSGAGDVDGDGHDDLLIGAPYDGDGGAAYLMRGPVMGTLDLAGADAKLVGESGGWGYGTGYSVSGAGDVDGDGNDDLLIGAPYDNAATGVAYLVRGPVMGTVDLAFADAKLLGAEMSDHAGQSVANAGDVNGDGRDDLLIGAPEYGEGTLPAGGAFLVLGPATSTPDLSLTDAKFYGENGSDDAGSSVSGAGDVNGDGLDDLLIGAPHFKFRREYSAGAAYLLLGPLSGPVDLALADATIVGGPDSGGVGTSVSDAGDVDGDGHDDVLIGATTNYVDSDGGGAAYLVLGPVTGRVEASRADATLVGELYSGVGYSVSGAGDVDGDGHVDLVIGAYSSEEGGQDAGATYLVLGPVSGTMDLSRSDATFVGEERNDVVGYSVAGVGDVDGDGLDDLLMGAPSNDAGGVDAGAAYLIYGGGF
jgi:hypothetical protein